MTLSTITVLCGCQKCKDHGVPFRGCCQSCLKEEARDNALEDRGFARFEPLVVNDAGFRPASRSQIAEWTAWLSSAEAAATFERSALKKAAALKDWGDYKFDPLRMEKFLDNYVWPKEHPEYMSGPMWTAYMHFGKEQRELLKSYNLVKKNIRTNEDYNRAEEAHKALQSHVDKHGQLIREVPGCEHKKPVKTSVAPQHVGRRAARRV
jgi:hypothetical protein